MQFFYLISKLFFSFIFISVIGFSFIYSSVIPYYQLSSYLDYLKSNRLDIFISKSLFSVNTSAKLLICKEISFRTNVPLFRKIEDVPNSLRIEVRQLQKIFETCNSVLSEDADSFSLALNGKNFSLLWHIYGDVEFLKKSNSNFEAAFKMSPENLRVQSLNVERMAYNRSFHESLKTLESLNGKVFSTNLKYLKDELLFILQN